MNAPTIFPVKSKTRIGSTRPAGRASQDERRAAAQAIIDTLADKFTAWQREHRDLFE